MNNNCVHRSVNRYEIFFVKSEIINLFSVVYYLKSFYKICKDLRVVFSDYATNEKTIDRDPKINP